MNPNLPGAHFELAEQLRAASDPELNALAEVEFKAAIQVNQYDELSWRQLGGVLSAKGDFKGAEAHYRKALALQPKDAEAKTGLAIVLISLNRTMKPFRFGKRSEGRSDQHRGPLPSERTLSACGRDRRCRT